MTMKRFGCGTYVERNVIVKSVWKNDECMRRARRIQVGDYLGLCGCADVCLVCMEAKRVKI